MATAKYFQFENLHYVYMGTFQLKDAGLLADPQRVFEEPATISPDVLVWLAAHDGSYTENILTGMPTFVFKSREAMLKFLELHQITIKD